MTTVILFAAALVGCVIWSVLFLMFASHYFLTTIIDSGSGQDEIEYSNETLFEFWWKPIFCLWILAFWVIALNVPLAPLLSEYPRALAVALALCLAVVYPLSVLSVLHAQNWFFFLDVPFLWHLCRRFLAVGYVCLFTLITTSVCVGLLAGVFMHRVLWALPAAFVLPTALLLGARHWGRLVWLAFNDTPRKKRKRKSAAGDADIPEMDVEEVDESAQGIRAGPPPPPSGAYATRPGMKPSPPAPVVQDEDEDEWSTNKKPYELIEEAPAEPAYALGSIPAADKPVALTDYYDEQMKQEKIRQEMAARPIPGLAPLIAPTFRTALLRGTWEFMIYSRTLQAWVNLVVLTAVELFLLYLVVYFWPEVN
jgi:hypothetical protein